MSDLALGVPRRVHAITILLLLLTPAAAEVANWGASPVMIVPEGGGEVNATAWLIPEGATIESGSLDISTQSNIHEGVGVSWSQQSPSHSFLEGDFSGSEFGHIPRSLTLSPSDDIGDFEDFEELELTFPYPWSSGGIPAGLWQPAEPGAFINNVTGQNRTTMHGIVPAVAPEGALLAATGIDTPISGGVDGWLQTPNWPIPAVVSRFNLSFLHWYHLNTSANFNGQGDGAWVEYSLDGGNWSWIEPVNGYDNLLSSACTGVNGANLTNGSLQGWASTQASGWQNATFSLDSISGVENASFIGFRFRIWTDPLSTTLRPGWFIDDISLTNEGSDEFYWFHGNLTGPYADDALSYLARPLNLSAGVGNLSVEISVEWDLEGGTFDNFEVEVSRDNQSWQRLTPAGGVPGNGYLIGNTNYSYETNVFVTMPLYFPSNYTGDESAWIRIKVYTDSSWGVGGANNPPEGLWIGGISIHNEDNTTLLVDDMGLEGSWNHSSMELPWGAQGADEWAHQTVRMHQSSTQDGFESSIRLPNGWAVEGNGFRGWEGGEVSRASGYGPQSSIGNNSVAIVVDDKYLPNTLTHLLSPEYHLPINATARLSFEHWICTETAWDGGAIYVSTDGGVSWSHFGSHIQGWYDGVHVNPASPFYGWWAFDGSGIGGGGPGCKAHNLGWMNKQVDLAPWMGDDVRFRFSFSSDQFFEYDGWYIDDFAVEVDTYRSEGVWTSQPIQQGMFGWGFLDVDAVVPEDTWVNATILDSNGLPIEGYINRTLPFSLAGIPYLEGDNISIRLNLGSSQLLLSPRIEALHLGTTRIFNPVGYNQNGWILDSGLVVSQQSRNISNPTTSPLSVTAQFLSVPFPIQQFVTSGRSSGVRISLLDPFGGVMSGGASLLVGATASLTQPSVGYGVEIEIIPGGYLDNLSITAHQVIPALNPRLDVGGDGEWDWGFRQSELYGWFGWQNHLHQSVDGNNTPIAEGAHLNLSSSPTNLRLLIPNGSLLNSGHLTVQRISEGSCDLSVSIESNSWVNSFTLDTNPSTFHLAATELVLVDGLQPTYVDPNSERDWKVANLRFSSDTTCSIRLVNPSFGYSLTEITRDLSDVITFALHSPEAEIIDGSVAIPIVLEGDVGGIAIDGSVVHEEVIQNTGLTPPSTLLPNGEMVAIGSTHHHLMDDAEIIEVVLWANSTDGTCFSFRVVELEMGGIFEQLSGIDNVSLQPESMVFRTDEGWVVEWVFRVEWPFDDQEILHWEASAFGIDGLGYTPAKMSTGGTGVPAVENDLAIIAFNAWDEAGEELTDFLNPDSLIPVAAGSEVVIEGVVTFENQLEVHPLPTDFSVGVVVGEGSLHLLQSESEGRFSGSFKLPSQSGPLNISPVLLMVGPSPGEPSAFDQTGPLPPLKLFVDTSAPEIISFELLTPNGPRDADRYIWDKSSDSIQTRLTLHDETGLGEEVELLYWRQGIDDLNSDGFPNLSEYHKHVESLPLGLTQPQVVNFPSFDISSMLLGHSISLFVRGLDEAGNPISGGDAGFATDLATVLIDENHVTEIGADTFSIDTVEGWLMPGVQHQFTFEVRDGNPIEYIDEFEVSLGGSESMEIIRYQPSKEDCVFSSTEVFYPTGCHHETLASDKWLVTVNFIPQWEAVLLFADLEWMPTVQVVEDGETSQSFGGGTDARWRLESGLRLEVLNLTDLTAPISASESSLYLKIDDEYQATLITRFSGSGEILSNPPAGLTVRVMLTDEWGSETIVVESQPLSGGGFTFYGSMTPITSTRYSLISSLDGLPEGVEDKTVGGPSIIVDSVSPSVDFSQGTPTILSSLALSMVPITLRVSDDFDLLAEAIEVNHFIERDGQRLAGSGGTVSIPLVEQSVTPWTWQGFADLSVSASTRYKVGDELLLWSNTTDLAGNPANGEGSVEAPWRISLSVFEFIPAIDSAFVSPEKVTIGETAIVSVMLVNEGAKRGDVELTLFGIDTTSDNGESLAELSTRQVSLVPFESKLVIMEYQVAHIGGQQLHLSLSTDSEVLYSVEGPLVQPPPNEHGWLGFDSGIGDPTVIGLLLLLLTTAVFLVWVIVRKDEGLFDVDEEE